MTSENFRFSIKGSTLSFCSSFCFEKFRASYYLWLLIASETLSLGFSGFLKHKISVISFNLIIYWNNYLVGEINKFLRFFNTKVLLVYIIFWNNLWINNVTSTASSFFVSHLCQGQINDKNFINTDIADKPLRETRRQ